MHGYLLLCVLSLILPDFPVSSYQHKETKRKIVRLEQCARSSLRRAIASQGAFAILDGLHSRYYIKKTEVYYSVSTFGFALSSKTG